MKKCYILHLIFGVICTFNHIGASTQITGGSDAPSGGVPYMCAVRIRKGNAESLCGCCIVSNLWVLTAAHCLEGLPIENARILVGTNNLADSDPKNENTRKYYNVNRWVIHELRRPDAFEYDIAVVQVKNAIQFNERTKPIAFSSNPVPFRANVQMTGWGGINNKGDIGYHLQTINFTIRSNSECHHYYSMVKDHNICTAEKAGQGSCGGDSGGPLVWKNEVVGVDNYGDQNCGSGWPSVYASVSYFFDWIKKNIGQ